MNAASEDIKDMIEAESALALSLGTTLFLHREPTTPDDCVTIYDTPSYPPEMAYSKEYTYYHSAVQIRIRNLDSDVGMSLARDIMDALHNRAQETWNAALYTVIQATGEPSLLAWDENGRVIFIINFNIQRR